MLKVESLKRKHSTVKKPEDEPKAKQVKSETVIPATRHSKRNIKKEESYIEEIPIDKKVEEVIIEDDGIETCSVTGISLSELADVRCEVMQEMLELPEHLRSRYFFEQSLEVKLQQYFDINDTDKLKQVSHSDPYKLGDEEFIKNIRKPVPKCPEPMPQAVGGSQHNVPPKCVKGEELEDSDSKKKGSNKPDEPGLSAKSKEKRDVPNSDSENKDKGEEKPTQIELENKDLSGNKDSEDKPKCDLSESSAQQEETKNKSDVPNSENKPNESVVPDGDSENKGKGYVPNTTQNETENKDINLNVNKDSENEPKCHLPELSAEPEESKNKSDVPDSENKPNESVVPDGDSENKGKGYVPETTQNETENKDINLNVNKDSENEPKCHLPESSAEPDDVPDSENKPNESVVPDGENKPNESVVPDGDSENKVKGYVPKTMQNKTENKDIDLDVTNMENGPKCDVLDKQEIVEKQTQPETENKDVNNCENKCDILELSTKLKENRSDVPNSDNEEKPHETEPERKDSETKNEESDVPDGPKKGEQKLHETETEGEDSESKIEESDVPDGPIKGEEKLHETETESKDSETKNEESDVPDGPENDNKKGEEKLHETETEGEASDSKIEESDVPDASEKGEESYSSPNSSYSGCDEDNANFTFESGTNSSFDGFDLSDIPALQVLCAECESEHEGEGDKLDASYVADVRKTVTSNVREALKDFNIDIDKEELTIEKMKEMCGEKLVECLRKTVRKNIHEALEAEDINLDNLEKKELAVVENR